MLARHLDTSTRVRVAACKVVLGAQVVEIGGIYGGIPAVDRC